MKYFKCENCGSELTKNTDDTYSCGYCKRTYYDDSLDKAYKRVYENLRGTVQGIVSEELFKQKVEQIANCRQALYKARNGQFIDSNEVLKWSEEILKLSPDDAQANFYAIAAKKRWSDLNKFMQKLNARETSYLVEGFVDYLTNGQFVEKCHTYLNDLIARAFDASSKDYAACHKKVAKAVELANNGAFDVSLPRHVFVAYSSKDKEKAYELVEYLEENGFSCFIAMRNLAKGVDAEFKYNERLKTAIDNCQVFVLVSSKSSRSGNCDAYRIEMQYVKDNDVCGAQNVALAKAQYDTYLEKNRGICKPRVEYLIEDYGVSPYERVVKQFFSGLTWCTDLEGVLKQVFGIIEGAKLDETEAEKLAHERVRIEKQKAELARKEEELSKKKTSDVFTDNLDDLYKAFKEREREEIEEQKRQAEEAKRERQKRIQEELARQAEIERRQKEEAERKRQEELDRKAQEERERQKRIQEELARQAEIERKAKEEAERKRREELKLKRAQDEFNKTFPIQKGILKGYNGKSKDCVVPDGVISLDSKCFVECTDLESVVLPKTVTTISARLFQNQKNLKSVQISGDVTEIGEFAFSGCTALTEIVIPQTVANIGQNAFAGCAKLKRIILPEGITSIAQGTFKNCKSLLSVHIPQTVTSIGEKAFAGCISLSDIVIPDNVNFIGEGVFNKCTALQSMTLPCLENIESKAFNSLFEFIFADNAPTALKSVKLTSGQQINDKIFSCCKDLTRIELSETITNIDENAFRQCAHLSEIKIHENNPVYKDIDGNLYSKDGKKLILCLIGKVKNEFTIPDGVESIDLNAFRYAKRLTSITISESVAFIGNSVGLGAFYYCEQLKKVNVTSIESWCNITFSRTSDNPLFQGAQLYLNGELVTALTIPYTVTKLKEYVFANCSSLKSVVIPNTVTSVGAYAFKKCNNLTDVKIEKGTAIGESAFLDCNNLSKDSKKAIANCMTILQKTKLCFFAIWQFIVWLVSIVSNGFVAVYDFFSDFFDSVCDFFWDCANSIKNFFSKYGKVILGVGIAIVVLVGAACLWIFEWYASWTVWQWIIGVIAGIAVLCLISICYKDLLLFNAVANMSIFLAVALVNGVALFFLKNNYEIIFACISTCEILVSAFISVDRCKGELSLDAIEKGGVRGEPKIGECIAQITITALTLVGTIVGLILI